MQKSLIYCRVSSERQKNEGHGLESQEHRCREYSNQKSYEVEKVFRDSFSGGGDFLKRPAMSEMLDYMDSKPYNKYIIIFDDIKRLARDTEQHLMLKKAIARRGATVECPNFVFNSSPEGKYVETIMAAGAELEREQNRRQVLQKMKARMEMGYWCLPSLPRGYKHNKNTPTSNSIPIPYEPEASIIKEALVGFASGRFQEQVDVQKFLWERKLKGYMAIYLEQVKRILEASLFYAGFVEFKPWEVSLRKGQHEGIIDIATHERIQDKLSGKVTTHVKQFLHPDFPIRGFVLCSECRYPMTASWSKGRSGRFAYYRCKTKSCIQNNKSIPKDKIEGEFTDILGKIKPSRQIIDLTKAIINDVWKKKELDVLSKRRQIETELAQIGIEQQRLMERITKAFDDKVISVYETRIGKLTDREMVLKESIMSFDKHKPNIETALDVVFDFIKNPLAQWQKGNIHTKRLVLKLVFEQNLSYNKNSGFETAILSLPLRVFTLPEAQKTSLVEMVSQSWNQIYPWFFEASEGILGVSSFQYTSIPA